MARPVVSETTEEIWGAEPRHMRHADELHGDFPLLRFHSLVGDEDDKTQQILERIAPDPNIPGDPSGLAHPEDADRPWLYWAAQFSPIDPDRLAGSSLIGTLAQLDADFASLDAINGTYASLEAVSRHGLLGTDPVRSAEDLRAALIDIRDNGWYPGSQGWFTRLIQPYLRGTKQVLFKPHYTGDRWHLRIESYAGETPQPGVVSAVIARNEDLWPAGVVVSYATTPGASLQGIADNFATLQDVADNFASLQAVSEYVPPPA